MGVIWSVAAAMGMSVRMLSLPPASSSRIFLSASSDSLLAMTAPAEPPPTVGGGCGWLRLVDAVNVTYFEPKDACHLTLTDDVVVLQVPVVPADADRVVGRPQPQQGGQGHQGGQKGAHNAHGFDSVCLVLLILSRGKSCSSSSSFISRFDSTQTAK